MKEMDREDCLKISNRPEHFRSVACLSETFFSFFIRVPEHTLLQQL